MELASAELWRVGPGQAQRLSRSGDDPYLKPPSYLVAQAFFIFSAKNVSSDELAVQSVYMLIRRFAAAALTSAVAPRWASSFITSGGTCRCSSQPPLPSIFSRGRQTASAVATSSNDGSKPSSSTSTMSAATGTGETPAAAVWDGAAGVWVGDKAAGHEGDIPSPLWIFG